MIPKFGLKLFSWQILTRQTPKLASYRNELLDLLRKPIDWFPYDTNVGV